METSTASDSGIKFRKRITPKSGVIGDRCLFTISVGASKQSVSDLVYAYLWAKKRFNIKAILLGDGLYRITLQICHGLSDSEAHAKSIQTGSNLLWRVLYGAQCPDIDIFKTSDILLRPEFEEARERIDRLYHSQPLFRESVASDANVFVDRQLKNGTLNIIKTKAVDFSISYLIQEIAVYLVMAERGWLTEVYLGNEIPALAKIMNNEIPGAPEALTQRVNIGLQKRLKKPRTQLLLEAA